jgi:hypothetical protein
MNMADVVIKRCPACPSIRSQVEEIAAALRNDLHVTARIEDGARGELSVFVDGSPVIRKVGDDLPSAGDVEEAVRGAVPTGV